jgi:hypothetical protein
MVLQANNSTVMISKTKGPRPVQKYRTNDNDDDDDDTCYTPYSSYCS